MSNKKYHEKHNDDIPTLFMTERLMTTDHEIYCVNVPPRPKFFGASESAAGSCHLVGHTP